jgi:hypothetical protein
VTLSGVFYVFNNHICIGARFFDADIRVRLSSSSSSSSLSICAFRAVFD